MIDHASQMTLSRWKENEMTIFSEVFRRTNSYTRQHPRLFPESTHLNTKAISHTRAYVRMPCFQDAHLSTAYLNHQAAGKVLCVWMADVVLQQGFTGRLAVDSHMIDKKSTEANTGRGRWLNKEGKGIRSGGCSLPRRPKEDIGDPISALNPFWYTA